MKDEAKNYLIAEAARKAIETADGNAVQVILREGKANDVKEPVGLDIVGNIDTPLRFLKQRKDDILLKDAHIEVSRDDMSIELINDEHSAYADNITGKLELAQDFLALGVNTGEYVSNTDLADRIKKLRTLFESREAAMRLVSELRNFKAKIERELELSDDKRGNVNIRKSQIVESNLPESLKVTCQIFKGQEPCTFEVEVEVNPNDLSCTLTSPEANDIVRTTRDGIIIEQLQLIESEMPELLIIEK